MDFSQELNLPESNDVFLFGDFQLNPSRGTLMRSGEEIPLRRQCFDVLIYLIQHHGILVTKKELMNAVWPDVVVTDSSVSQCIYTIRRALGDDSKTLIRSMPRSGYLFDASVKHKVIATIRETTPYRRFKFTGIPKFSSTAPITLALAIAMLIGLQSSVIENHEEPQPVVSSSLFPENGLTTLHGKLTGFINDNETLDAADNTSHEAIKHYELGKFFYGRRAPGDLLRAIDEFRSAVSLDPQHDDAWVGLAGALWVGSNMEVSRLPGNQKDYIRALEKALEINLAKELGKLTP